jgi:hypothetical protein
VKTNGHKRPDAAEVKQAAANQWRQIIPAITGISSELLDGKGHPCPACGGTDRFSVFSDFATTGGINCRGCHATNNGDGLAAVAHFLRVDFPEAVRLVAEHLGLDRGGEKPVSASTKPHRSRDSRGSVDKPRFENLESLIASYRPRQPSRVDHYHLRDGLLVGAAIRFDNPDGSKDVLQARREGDGRWSKSGMADPRPLFNLPQIVSSQGQKVVFEGEKAATAAISIGLLATTFAGGCKAAKKTDYSPLAGTDVLLCPDHDKPGRDAMVEVANQLALLRPQPRVRRLELTHLPGGAEMPEGGDIFDWIEAHGDAATPETIAENFERLVEKAETIELAKPDTPLSWQPFPVDCLPPVMRDFVVRGGAAIGCDPVFVLIPLLVVCAALIGTYRRLRLKRSWTEPAVFWAAIVGESGTQKTPAFMMAMRWLKRLQADAHKAHAEAMAAYEEDKQQFDKELEQWKRGKGSGQQPSLPVKPVATRFLVSDTTIEALVKILRHNLRGVLSATDELAGWFGSFDRYRGGKASSDSANWLSMFNAGFVQSDRVASGTHYVSQAAVSVVGGIQPGILRRAFSDEHRESGLAARMLLVCPPRRPKRWTDSDLPELVELRMDNTLEGLLRLRPAFLDETEVEPIIATMSDEARQLFIQFVNAHGAEAADMRGDLAAAWSKLEAYAARLALVLHYVRLVSEDLAEDADENVVDAETMENALEIIAWFKQETRRVYAMFTESKETQQLRELAEWIGTRGGCLSLREIQAGRRELKTADETEAAVNRLVDSGFGERFVDSPGSKGGRPGEGFRLFTLSTSTKPHETREFGGSVDAEDGFIGEPAFAEWGTSP